MTNQSIRQSRALTTAGAALAIGGLALTILLGGCGSSQGDSSTTSRGAAPEPGNDIAAPAAPADAGGKAAIPGPVATGNAADGGTGTKLPPQAVARSVIYNGAITIRVPDVKEIATRAAALATSSGGYVGGDNRTSAGEQSSATIVLRVPSARFDATMTALGALGDEKDRQVSTQDVTQQVVDVSARLKTQQASVTRVRALLAQATSLAQIVSIEGELSQREADLESLEAQLASLTDQTSLSTITAVILGPEAHVTVVAKEHKGFVAGLKSGWHAFQSSVSVLLTVVGAILPFAVLVGLVLVIWLLARRRRQGARLALTTAGAAPMAAPVTTHATSVPATTGTTGVPATGATSLPASGATSLPATGATSLPATVMPASTKDESAGA